MCGTHTGGKGCGDDSVGLTDVVAVRGGRGAWSVDVFVAFLFPRGGCDDGGGAVERPAEGGKEREGGEEGGGRRGVIRDPSPSMG
jgi:hypothetical protein